MFSKENLKYLSYNLNLSKYLNFSLIRLEFWDIFSRNKILEILPSKQQILAKYCNYQ